MEEIAIKRPVKKAMSWRSPIPPQHIVLKRKDIASTEG